MGRKMKELTDEQAIQLEVMARFLTVEQIADIFEISRTTFYEMMKRDERINELYKKGRANQILKFATNLSKQSDAGNTAATIFALKTQGGWKDVHVLDHQSSDGSMTPQIIERIIIDPKQIDDELHITDPEVG